MNTQVAMKLGSPHYFGRLIRIPSNLSKRNSKPLINWPLGWKGLVVHGGGGVAFQDSHPLVQHLAENYCSEGVYSLELPSHGLCASSNPVTSEQARNSVYNLVSPIIDSETIVVAYSVGGMFMTSLWKSFCYVMRLNPMGVFIGCHPRIVTRWYGIRTFWSTPYTYLSRRHKFLREKHCGDEGENHKEYWKTTIDNTRDWLNPSSAIQASNQDLEFLIGKEMKTHWIISKKDIAFPGDYFMRSIGEKVITGGKERMMSIPGTHFSYFSKYWPYTQLAIDQVLRGFSSSDAEYIR